MSEERSRPRRETRRRAREAVEPDRMKEVLAEAGDGELDPDDGAEEALREAAAEETAEIAEDAARRARRRGRSKIESEDVARANEKHQERKRRER